MSQSVKIEVAAAAVLAIAALGAGVQAHGSEDLFTLTEEINQRFGDASPRGPGPDSVSRLELAISFSRAVSAGEPGCALREDQLVAEISAAESAIANDFSINDERVNARYSARRYGAIWGVNSDASPLPQPPADFAPQRSRARRILDDAKPMRSHVAMEGVAMRFEDEQFVFGGVRFSR